MTRAVGNQSPLPLIDLWNQLTNWPISWESVTSPFDRLTATEPPPPATLGISHLSL